MSRRRLFVSEAALDQREVAVFVVPVKFVADDRVTEVREMDPNLVLAPGLPNPQQAELAPGTRNRLATVMRSASRPPGRTQSLIATGLIRRGRAARQ